MATTGSIGQASKALCDCTPCVQVGAQLVHRKLLPTHFLEFQKGQSGG